MNFVALDFETANEQRGSACAIGIAVVENGQVVQSHYHLIRPYPLRFSSWNSRIHGITEDHVKESPVFADLWPTIRPILECQLVVAHNASFDMSVLRYSLHAARLEISPVSYLCSLQMARRAWPQLASHSLNFLATRHDIELDHHNAESDAKAASEIILRIAQDQALDCPYRLAESIGVTVGDLISDGNWIPSSSPRFCKSDDSFDLTLPDDFDISSHPLYGKNVAITGTLAVFTRSKAFEIVELFGGTPKKSVSKTTDILVTGSQDMTKLASGKTQSSKLRKASDLRSKGCPIQIITDGEFQQYVFQFTKDT